jgi:hypothetical protein
VQTQSSWDAATKTRTIQYGWGAVVIVHKPAGPLALGLKVTITNDPPNKTLVAPAAISNLGLLLFDQPLNTSQHNNSDNQIRGGFGPCPGCWNGCGCFPGKCTLEYPQAVSMDFGTASAAWVIVGDANVSGIGLSANSCTSPGQHFYRPEMHLPDAGSQHRHWDLYHG